MSIEAWKILIILANHLCVTFMAALHVIVFNVVKLLEKVLTVKLTIV